MVVKTPDGYVVGGDSLRNYANGFRPPEHVCKIRVNHNVALLVWGSGGSLDDHSRDLRSISQPFLDDPLGTPKQRSTALMNSVEKNAGLKSQLQMMSSHQAGWAFIGRQQVGAGDIKFLDGSFISESLPDTAGSPFVFPEVPAAASYLRTHARATSASTAKAKALVLGALQSAAKQYPQVIGAPFSVISITRTGVVWLERGACQQ